MKLWRFIPIVISIIVLSSCLKSETGNNNVYKNIYFKILKTSSKHPDSIAIDKRGNLYVSDKDQGNIEMIRANGDSVVIAKNIGAPSSITFDGFGNLYFIDDKRDSLFFIDKIGNIVQVTDKLESPSDVIVDRYGRIFVLSSENGTITKFKL